MSDSVRPHRQQPTRLRHPWDSPGKNSGVGYHFLLQCMKVKSESEVTQSYPTLMVLIKKQEFVRIWRNWTLTADGNGKWKISVTLENNLAVLQIPNIELSYNPAIPFLSIYPRKIRLFIHTKMCT